MQDPSAAAFQAAIKAPKCPLEEQHLRCPRCDSTNTKFCYYNNYNLSQPRHYCRNCRRYWTRGGALRNVPVGGGTRKSSKRGASPSSSPSSSSSPSPSKRPNTISSSFPAPPAATTTGPPLQIPSLGAVGNGSDNMAAPRAPETVLRLQGDSNCWNGGGGGWPDLSIYTPRSKFQ